jgi:hypothetical protein
MPHSFNNNGNDMIIRTELANLFFLPILFKVSITHRQIMTEIWSLLLIEINYIVGRRYALQMLIESSF